MDLGVSYRLTVLLVCTSEQLVFVFVRSDPYASFAFLS